MFTRRSSQSINVPSIASLLRPGGDKHNYLSFITSFSDTRSLSSTIMRPLIPSLSAFMLRQGNHGDIQHRFGHQSIANYRLLDPIMTNDIARRFSSVKAYKLDVLDAVFNASAGVGPTRGKSANRNQRKRKNKRSQGQRKTFTFPTTGPTGRVIMTESLLQNDALLSSLPYDVKNNPKNMLNSITKLKLQYTQHIEFDTAGPPGNQSFLATTHTTFEHDNARNELVCTGMGRSKKLAELYAAVDLIKALKEIGIDAKNPPDIRAVRKQRYEERFQGMVARAQMLLECLGSSRPQFIVEEVKGGWQATVSLWLRGEIFTAVGPVETNKAKSEGAALIEIMDRDGELVDNINASEGRDVIQHYLDVIDASPGKHIAALRVDPLPNEVAWEMLDVIGPDNGRHEERMRAHESVKAEYEERFGVSGRKHFRSRKSKKSMLDYERINEALKTEEEQKLQHGLDNPDGKHAKMNELRDALPITAIRQELLDALKTDQVVVVSGGTGSGKSTQCPQYILEDALLSSKGAHTEIIVTQPRKIAAISVAERVADERNEKPGNSVGYSVRFHQKAAREAGGTVEFVTTGVLLNRIMNDPMLEGVSHVVIDEVHERDINTDFLLILLRDLLKQRPDLRVVLMSATLNADSFSNYFNSVNDSGECKHLSVPTAPRHPVEVFYLEDMLSMDQDVQELAQSLSKYHDEKLRSDLDEAEQEVAAALQLETRSHDEDEGLLLNSDTDSDDEDDDLSPTSPASRVKTLRRAVSFLPDEGNVSSSGPNEREACDSIVKLVSKLALHLSTNELDSGRKGSILCFLPGWDEIKAATALLEEEADMELRSKINILPLHSTIPQEDQQKVFIPAEDDTVKVILATNIAESSVTIDDVLSVVDGGLVRELCYDAESAMSTMQTNPTSRASATQRLGRAGRVAPGKCYRLYSRGSFEAMSERPTPEIQRTALESTCLQTSTIAKDGIEKFLGHAMDPPQSESVSIAVDRLVKLGALCADENSESNELLTPLGRTLSRLPLDPACGKMLIMGVVMRCLDPVVTAAACFSSRNVFYNPPGCRDEAQEIRRSFSKSSDTTAQILAYKQFWETVDQFGFQTACDWAKENYISIAAMISIKAVRSQLLNELRNIGLLEHSDLKKTGYKQFELCADANVNRYADNGLLHNAVLASSIPGNISSRRQLGSFGTLRTRTENHSGIHPSCVSFHRTPPRGITLPNWYSYREMVLSSQVFLRDCTAMRPEQLVLFGGYTLGTLKGSPHPVHIIDDWIVVESACDETLRCLQTARREINTALEYKVMYPKHPLPLESQEAIDIICDMFDVLQWGGE